MDERDATSPGSLPRYCVYKLVTGRPTSFQRGIEIGHAIADVVNSGSAPCKESGDRAIGATRGEQLDFAVAEWERYDVRTVGHFGRMRLEPENFDIERGRRGQIRDGDTDMGDAGLAHARSPDIGAALCGPAINAPAPPAQN